MNHDDLLAEALEGAADEVRTATNERNELIHKARAQGWSLRRIGRHVGLTHTGVAKILRRTP